MLAPGVGPPITNGLRRAGGSVLLALLALGLLAAAALWNGTPASAAPGTGALYPTDWYAGSASPTATELHIEVASGACDYPNYREYDPYDHATVEQDSDRIVVTTYLRDTYANGDYVCAGVGKLLPVTIHLDAPLAYRSVYDGSTVPPTRRIDASEFAYPISTYNARWSRLGPRRVTRRTRRLTIGIHTHTCPPDGHFDPLAVVRVLRSRHRVVIRTALRDTYRDTAGCRPKDKVIRKRVGLKGRLGRRAIVDGFDGHIRVRAPKR